MAAGAMVLLLIVVTVFALLFSGGGGNREQLVRLAQRHTEIIRIAEIGSEKSKGTEARNLAVTTRLSLQSSKSSLLEAVQKTGKVGNEELSAGRDQEVDADLEAAERNNRFDEVFIEVLSGHLTEYRAELQSAFTDSSNKNSKKVYSDIFGQVGALLPASE